jgi:hypothetical protein
MCENRKMREDKKRRKDYEGDKFLQTWHFWTEFRRLMLAKNCNDLVSQLCRGDERQQFSESVFDLRELFDIIKKFQRGFESPVKICNILCSDLLLSHDFSPIQTRRRKFDLVRSEKKKRRRRRRKKRNFNKKKKKKREKVKVKVK